MSFEIPQELEYKEIIAFGLTFRQLAYAVVFSLLTIICFTKVDILWLKSLLCFILIVVGLAFVFLDLNTKLRDWKSFFSFRSALLMDEKMFKFMGLKKIVGNRIVLNTGSVSVLRVFPLNFMIKNHNEKEAVTKQFQLFLNSLDFPVQFVIATEPLSMDSHFRELSKKAPAEFYDDYEKHLSSVIADTKAKDRVFYVVMPNDDSDIQLKLVQHRLSSIGLRTEVLGVDDLQNVVSRFFDNYSDDLDKSAYYEGKLDSANFDHCVTAPIFIKNFPDRLQVNTRYNRFISAVGYPRVVDFGFLDRIITMDGSFDVSIHVEPFPVSETMVLLNRELQKQRADLFSLQSKQILNQSLEIKYEDTKSILEGLQKGHEKLFKLSFYINCSAENKAGLELLTRKIKSELNASMILPSVPLFRQVPALRSMLPFCDNKLAVKRSITTKPLSAFFPFTSSFLEIDENGCFLGLNQNNVPVIKDIFSFPNPNGLVLASSGAGKSYWAKLFVMRHLLAKTKVMIIDPQNEYSALIQQFKGQVVNFSRTSKTVINPLDLMGHSYAEKRLALMDLLPVMIGTVSEIQKAVLDRAITMAYSRKGITESSNTWKNEPPILADLLSELERMSKSATITERETYRSLINRLSMFVSGVFSFFNRQTCINFSADLVGFVIGDMPKQAKPVNMFLILDYVYMKMRKSLDRKLLVIDEAWSLLSRAEDSDYILEIVKTSRKYNLGLLLITQDVGDLIDSRAGSAVLQNSSYKILMRQQPAVINSIVETFHLSSEEKSKLLTAQTGEALLLTDNEHSELKIVASAKEHLLITTRPDEIIMEKDDSDITEIKEKKKVNITLDLDKGFFRKKELSDDEVKFLLANKYVASEHVPLGGGRREMFFLKPTKRESNSHLFLVKAIEEYLKKYTDKIRLAETVEADVMFWIGRKKYAIEVETGKNHDYPYRVTFKSKQLNQTYGDNWFFVVSYAPDTYKYEKYGKVLNRNNVCKMIDKCFKKALK